MSESSGQFRPDPIAYLDQVAASSPGRTYKERVLGLLDLKPGQTVLDIGCGPGTDLATLAAAIAPSGRVVGVDQDPVMVAQARARLAEQPLIRNATIGRSLARLCTEADLRVRSVVTMAPVFRDFNTADQLLGLRRNVARAVAAGYLNADAETWIEEVGAPPFLATALLFLVVAEVPA